MTKKLLRKLDKPVLGAKKLANNAMLGTDLDTLCNVWCLAACSKRMDEEAERELTILDCTLDGGSLRIQEERGGE